MTLCETWIVFHRILEVLVGKVMCFFPILILCLVHGFCPAHPHPEGGSWIFAWTPWAGFTLGCPNMFPAASRTRVTIPSGTRWLNELLKEGKAANKAKKARPKSKADKAKTLADLVQTNGMVSGDCDKYGKVYIDLRAHKLCRGRRTTVPARLLD